MTNPEPESDDLSLWQSLFSDDCLDLRTAALSADLTDASALQRLRSHGVDQARVAVEWALASRKAANKFPGREIIGDVAGVEQASSLAVARYKAARFAAAGLDDVVDLCSGIGGDSIALSEVAKVVAIDRSAKRSWMCGRNAGCEVLRSDVRPDDLAALFSDPRRGFHLDPDRRAAHRTTGSTGHLWDIEDYSPGPEFMERLLETGASGAIKLGPGVDLEAVPGALDHEIELISEGRRLVQAVLWVGQLARGAGVRTATILPSEGLSETPSETSDSGLGSVVSVSSPPGRIRVSPDAALREFLFEPAPALERARLLHTVAGAEEMRELCPGIGVATGDVLPDLRWFSAWRVIASKAWKDRGLKAWVKSQGCVVDQVKTRGGAIQPAAIERQLKSSRTRSDDATRAVTLFGLRLGKKRIAVLGERVLADPDL